MPRKIAALYVKKNGPYYGLEDVDPWDEERDARKYIGPYPGVYHPPCQRWGKLWAGNPSVIAKTGIRKIKGDDGGCFEHALWGLSGYGGVLEHPWQSHAWPHFGLTVPAREGGWILARKRRDAGEYDLYTCCVEQGRYGHYARKPTMLLAGGVLNLPDLRWGHSEMKLDPVTVARIGLKAAKRRGEVGDKGGGTDSSCRIGTPTEFRELLISLARSVR